MKALGIPYRPLARRTSMAESPGRIKISPRDAVIHGTEITRTEEGSLEGWKNQETLVSWRVEFPAAGSWRAHLLTGDSIGERAPVDLVVAGRTLPCRASGSVGRLDCGAISVDKGSPRLLFLRGREAAAAKGYGTIKGAGAELELHR